MQELARSVATKSSLVTHEKTRCGKQTEKNVRPQECAGIERDRFEKDRGRDCRKNEEVCFIVSFQSAS